MVMVVKRRGKKESFDEKKLYASVYSACKEVDMETQACEHLAGRISNEVKHSLHGRADVTSTEIFGLVIQKLAKSNEAAAFMYETHRDMQI